ncbi:hypothetical protein JHN55_25215 [Streptomyces sp. MBT56]|uniref:hypothetical protein n=1 Tax=unclassified Streptomyces TaxID=2593676 RepID=UPI00190C9BCF|nr:MULTISPECIES: hypothetical protein [unclassified Streptomyces]MBK3559765.1 hypothetical protein [Streptomyces sp. MBT56]MBK3601293.1 hypothetical protein [Streptomyces sp. MBT54]MBK3615260.1 hypothetical protein [Streptomyces sp. MBT98]
MPEEQKHGGGVGLVGLIILVALGVWAYNAFKPVKWEAFYESPSVVQVARAAEFKKKEDCQAWIYSQRLLNDGRYGFECGNNCTPPKTQYGPYSCEDTMD